MPTRTRLSPARVHSYLGRSTRRREPFSVDVSDRGDEFLVSVELPGLRKQNLDIRVHKDKLEINADFGDDATEGTYLRRERRRGTKRRVIHLPEWIDEKHVSASYNDGILWVTLRKRKTPEHIEIK